MADQYFGSSYTGDPGVPHSGPQRFENVWLGSLVFSAFTWFNPYMCALSTHWNFHDHDMLFEQYHWKKAKARGKKYKFMYNEKDRAIRDSYYQHQSVCFP